MSRLCYINIFDGALPRQKYMSLAPTNEVKPQGGNRDD